MNLEKKNGVKGNAIFKIDPDTGKIVPLPVKWLSPSVRNCERNNLGDNPMLKNSKRKTVLEPLKFSIKDFKEVLDSPTRSVKKRKIDNTVRKELFNLPKKGTQISRPSINHRQSLSRKNITKKSKGMVKPKSNLPEMSPLLDMEEVEEELINKKGCLQGYPFKTPTKPAIKFSRDVKKLEIKCSAVKDLSEKTPDSMSSNEEFLKLEKMCDTKLLKQNICNQSPVSSVCNLLEGTMLNSIEKRKKPLINDATNIDSIVIAMETFIEKDNTAIEQYKSSREEKMTKVLQILEADQKEFENLVYLQNENNQQLLKCLFSLKCLSTDKSDKENSGVNNRRSIRLLNKSPIQAHNAKLIVSPTVNKSHDLRKTTLTKNLVTKNQQYQMQSPRAQKAMTLYKSVMHDASILSTPKLDRNFLCESPMTSNMSRSLSRRIQNQCLLLQDTPMAKKP